MLRKHRGRDVTLKKILMTGLGLATAYVVVRSIPDLARYIKLRSM